MRRLDETIYRSGGSGDNWHTTWAQDGRAYTALCDGRGWPQMVGHTGKDYNTRVYAVEGGPLGPTFVTLPGYPELLTEPSPRLHRYYGFGIIALDGGIYHYLSTPNHPFNQPNPRFVGAKLIYSPDTGRTWRNQDGGPVRWEEWGERQRGNMVFFEEEGDALALLTVLQMGQNYRDNRDGYVYVYAPNGSVDGTMNQLVLFRVPRARILDRSAYEFFVARQSDGSATWHSDIRARGIVHTFPSGWVNTQVHPYAWHPSVVYNAPLGVYMMANWGMGCAPDGMWFGKPSYLGFWTAPQPWGPWTQVSEETAWMPVGDAGARAYQPQILPQWIAADGKSFWLAFTDFQVRDGKRPYYCFNCQKVEIRTD
jgi:hypothetical protein